MTLPIECAEPRDALLHRASELLHIARRAAAKLNVEMNLRHSMPKWAELEALTEQREAMCSWGKECRKYLDNEPK